MLSLRFLLAHVLLLVVQLALMRSFVLLFLRLKFLQSLLVPGVLGVGLLQLVQLRVFVQLLLVVACGFLSLPRLVQLGCCPRLPNRVVSPALVPARGLHLPLRLGLVCRVWCFWGRFLFPLGGVCSLFLVCLGGSGVQLLLVVLTWFSCLCFSFFGWGCPLRRREGALCAPSLLFL
jgi:hypothetical protein